MANGLSASVREREPSVESVRNGICARPIGNHSATDPVVTWHHSRDRADREREDDDTLCRIDHINAPDKNIITVEDPVEYQLLGVGQMQVNPKINLTFAAGYGRFSGKIPMSS
jgi:Type II secretory pathway, ATPase PulE/Tfp pilus assembly pathway, ATPase PilB